MLSKGVINKMKYDENMKKGDLVRVCKSAVRGDYDFGIVLEIRRDTTYEDVERYHVKYWSFNNSKYDSQWANHVEVISST